MNKKYITLGQAKLLKSKGFNSDNEYNINCVYNCDFEEEFEPKEILPSGKGSFINALGEFVFECPEQHQVLDWMFNKHKIYIIVKYPQSSTNKVKGINSVYYDLEIYELIRPNTAMKIYIAENISDKKEKAYSAGIDYCLEYLIRNKK